MGQAKRQGPLVRLKNRLQNQIMLTQHLIAQARSVIDQQRAMYQAIPKETISSMATTTQIHLIERELRHA